MAYPVREYNPSKGCIIQLFRWGIKKGPQKE